MGKSIRSNDYIAYGHFSEFKGSGVYMIECTVNNKQYIGSSKDVSIRLAKHFSELRLNRHTNSKLQKDYNEFGIDSFNYCILEYTDDLLNKEVEYQLKVDMKSLYNEKITGHYMNEELLKKYASSNKDSHKTQEYRDKMSKLKSQRVCQFDKSGKFIAIHDSIVEAIKLNPTYKAQPIRGVCNGSKKTAYNYLWRYEKDCVETNDEDIV